MGLSSQSPALAFWQPNQNKQAVRVATRYAPAPLLSVWAP